jgi:hypothetical protein
MVPRGAGKIVNFGSLLTFQGGITVSDSSVRHSAVGRPVI